MCLICDALGQWICCGGIWKLDQRCLFCGCTKVEDAAAIEMYEALHRDVVAAGRYPSDRDFRAFKLSHGFGKLAS